MVVVGWNIFGELKLMELLFPWKLLRYNYRSHRRVLVIDGQIGFTGGYGISDAWTGNGRTPEHWRDTNARIEGPVVKFLQAAFAESWLETTGIVIGGNGYFPRLEPLEICRHKSSRARQQAAAFKITCCS